MPAVYAVRSRNSRRVACEIREDGRGRHTTTARELHVLPGGGLLVDTPGMRELALYDDEEGVATAYADVTSLAEECRFRDCAHRTEPGCAVAAAIDDGRLDPAQAAGRGPSAAAAGRRPCPGRGEGAAAHLLPIPEGAAQPDPLRSAR